MILGANYYLCKPIDLASDREMSPTIDRLCIRMVSLPRHKREPYSARAT